MAKVLPVPAPVGGWNARDAWADMAETDAVLLDNWYPSAGEVVSRKGIESYATGLGGSVESLMVYRTGSAQKMLAGANGNIWDVSSGGAGSSLGSGYSENKWQHATLGSTMGIVNGTDSPRSYNGSTISALSLTGPTAANVIGVHVFKSRSYFWEDGSQSFWYSAINTMGGTVTEFQLGRLGVQGQLMTMTSWTRDGGDGMDDLAVFIFASGDVVIYQGSDPGSEFTWSLVGIYRIAAPIGRRCTMKYGGDVVVITRDGYVSLAETIMRRSPSVTDKIRNAVKSAAVTYGGNSGWQGVVFDAAGFALFNVPITTTESRQHVVNLQTGAWCRFTNWDARCWAVYNDLLYFGASGVVYRAWTGTSDAGSAIELDAVPAFNYFKSGNIKQVTAVQPSLKSNGILNLGIITERDFALSARPEANLSVGETSSPWGSPWGSPWSRGATLQTPFKTVTKVGRALTARMTANVTNHNVSWYATTYFYETGGFV